MKKPKNSGVLTALSAIVVTVSLAASACGTTMKEDDPLKFRPDHAELRTLSLPDGKTVLYTAYECIYYVTNVEDSTYQYLNFYVPDGADSTTPILLRTYVGGYMAAPAMQPSPTDATGRALAEGYVVCIPGARGWNSRVGETYTGRAPNGLLDLKAAVRYLRHNDSLMAGNAEMIITDGTSAGGAMSSLLGATGNAACYETYLEEMGAANAPDNVFASVCYCPITDLDHADMAYEWLYGCTNDGVRGLSEEQKELSGQLAVTYPEYLNGLGLKDRNGNCLNSENFLDYIKSFIIASAQRALNEGCEIPDGIGIEMNSTDTPFGRRRGEFVTGVDMQAYLSHVAGVTRLKTPPAFDSMGILGGRQSPENSVFGDKTGSGASFTAFSSQLRGFPIDESLEERVKIMNPLNFIGKLESDIAPHWYIRHGARDRDTSFAVPVILATRLMNEGYDVDFFMPWNRPHSGDYNLDDLFSWIARIVSE